MIISKNGDLRIEGEYTTVLAELTVAIKGVREALLERGLPQEYADEQIDLSVELSRMNREELKAKQDELLRTAIFKLLKEAVDFAKEETTNA